MSHIFRTIVNFEIQIRVINEKVFADESFTRDEIKEMNFRKLSRIRSGFREMNTKIPKISIIIPGKMIPTVKTTIFNRFYEITLVMSHRVYIKQCKAECFYATPVLEFYSSALTCYFKYNVIIS